jgi:hypothetical protein
VLRQSWTADPDPVVASAGRALTTGRVAKKPEGLDLAALLDVIEAEMRDAPDRLQWAMNHCQNQIGIDHPEYRARAVDIGERLEASRTTRRPRTARPPTRPSGSPRSSGAARPVGGACTWTRAGPDLIGGVGQLGAEVELVALDADDGDGDGVPVRAVDQLAVVNRTRIHAYRGTAVDLGN